LRWTVHADPAHSSGVANSSQRTATGLRISCNCKKRVSPQKHSRQPSNCVQRLHVRRSGPSPPFESRKGGAAERGSGDCGAPLRASTRRPTGIDRVHFAPPRCVVRPQAITRTSVQLLILSSRPPERWAAADTAESDPITLAVPRLDPPPMPSTGRNFRLPTGIRS
jgi:hypothetical protein